MKILTIQKTLLNISTTVFFLTFSFAQDSKSKVNQDPRFEQLLSEKRKINSSITINDRYKIQIFTGDAATSKKTLTDFRKNNKNIDATIVFHTPIYKVWAGSYKTRIEAEKKLQQLKKNYPNAFLIKPNK
jgi:hypothetical protein